AAEEHAPAAGIEHPVLRGVSQVRRRQSTARTGRKRSARTGARHRPPAPGAQAHARAARGLRRARGAESLRVAADGRAVPREAHDREAEGPARADAARDGARGGEPRPLLTRASGHAACLAAWTRRPGAARRRTGMNTIVSAFDNRAAAHAAADRLIADGFAADTVQLHDHASAVRNVAALETDELASGGFFTNLLGLFEQLL